MSYDGLMNKDQAHTENKDVLVAYFHHVSVLNEPRYEKTGFLQMRKQRRRSASR